MEFRAVVLCGPGNRLHPITPGVPKPLLPVGNKPLVQCVIEWCEKAGFAGTIIAVSEHDHAAVEEAVHAVNPSVKLFRYPEGTPSGKVLKLLQAAGLVTHDLAVLPCDFVTDHDPEALISAVRAQDDNAAITGFYYRNNFEQLDLKTLEPSVLLHSPADATDYLLDSYERKAVKEAKALRARMTMLWRFPHVLVTMDLLRSSIFFISKAVLDYEEINFDRPLPKVVTHVARRTWRHRVLHEAVVMQELSTKDNLFVRANNLAAFMEANRHFLRQKARTAHLNQEDRKREPGQAIIGNDSLVGTGTTVGERSSVKRTAIGKNCTIGKKCRLNGCVILDNVHIGGEVTLENCIIGPGANVETHSKLIGCSIEGGYVVVSETEAKNEVLKGLSMEGLDDEDYSKMYESLSDESSGGGDVTDEELSDQEIDEGGDDDFFDRS